MPKTVVAAEENVEKTYLSRLWEALGAKGVVVLLAVPLGLGVSAVAPEIVGPVAVGASLTTAFVLAAIVDSLKDPRAYVDVVGTSLVVISGGYTALVFAEIGFDWRYGVGAAGLVLGAVAYDYISHSGDVGVAELHETDVDPLHLDVVGFVAAEIVVVYSVLHATGWASFADSPVFVILAYILYTSTVAAFAGYAVITKEIVVSRTADEVHNALVSVLHNLIDVENEELRKGLALNIRRMAECLDGVRIPTRVKDRYGRIPAVVSTRKPDVSRLDMTIDDVLKVADESGFTGYAVHEGEEVTIFRNGEFSKHYHDGRYTERTDDIEDIVRDVSFYALEYPTVKSLIEVTPREGDIVNPAKAVEDMEDKEIEGNTTADRSLSIGGEEVEVGEMFSITEELVEEGSERETDGTLEVGGDEIDVDEILDKADDVIDDLSE
jgi:hypothetical protein